MTKKAHHGGDGPLCEFSALCYVNYACWFISSLKVVSFFSHFRFRQYSFNSLFFQSNIAHVVHQFFVFAVELDNFFRIFVRRSHLFDQAFHALFVSFQLVGADNFAQQQANNYAAFSLFFEQFARQFQSLFFVATETLCSPATQNRRFRCRSAQPVRRCR